MKPSALPSLPKLSPEERRYCDRVQARVDSQLERLRTVNPVLLDLSIREPSVGTALGHTVDNKLELLALARRMGFRDILLATFDVSLPDEPQVDDDFMQLLVERGEDLTGGFAFTSIALGKGTFKPNLSMLKTAEYGIPNTIVDLDISRESLPRNEKTRRRFLAWLAEGIQWFHDNLTGDRGGPPRIYINYQDMTDAYTLDREWVLQLTRFLASQPIAAVTFEDGRGTLFPFQIGAAAAELRHLLPPDKRVLVHIHSGNGMENAGLLEALLQGADGVWAGFSKEAATIGHASGAELLANLARINNPHVQRKYRLDELLLIANRMTEINTRRPPPDDFPIIGANAYRMMLSAFAQKPGKPMDLPPERIGGAYGYRITAVASDIRVIARRLREVLGPIEPKPSTALLDTMRRLMRRDLRAGIRLAYDEPAQLRDLYERARALVKEQPPKAASRRGKAA
ncbi:MAG TPA: hypothetical protein VF815_34195 [Myxococcaceae bacterium]